MLNLRHTLMLVALMTLPLRAFSADPVNTGWFSSVAIDGYDPVAYFEESRAVKGKQTHTYQWNGAEWRFSTAEHRARFVATPEQYAPQYGGYCAYAVAQGDTADIDPEAWSIVDGKLYLNYNHEIQAQWESDRSALIRQADAHWPAVVE